MKQNLFERPQGGERAILVHVQFPENRDQEEIDEFRELALSAGVQPVALMTCSRAKPDAKYFVGSGKAEEIRMAVDTYTAEVVLVNHILSPSQERNLEKITACRDFF